MHVIVVLRVRFNVLGTRVTVAWWFFVCKINKNIFSTFIAAFKRQRTIYRRIKGDRRGSMQMMKDQEGSKGIDTDVEGTRVDIMDREED